MNTGIVNSPRASKQEKKIARDQIKPTNQCLNNDPISILSQDFMYPNTYHT